MNYAHPNCSHGILSPCMRRTNSTHANVDCATRFHEAMAFKNKAGIPAADIHAPLCFRQQTRGSKMRPRLRRSNSLKKHDSEPTASSLQTHAAVVPVLQQLQIYPLLHRRNLLVRRLPHSAARRILVPYRTAVYAPGGRPLWQNRVAASGVEGCDFARASHGWAPRDEAKRAGSAATPERCS